MTRARCLVLGGTAFIGRHLVEHLLAQGQAVTVLNRGTRETPAGVELLIADRRNRAAMRQVLTGREWDVVYDVSASMQVTSVDDLNDLLDFLDGRCGIYEFVSSVAAYRIGNGAFPWTEDLPTSQSRPTGYGGHKATVERMLVERRAKTGFAYTVVRPGAVYGPHNNLPDGEIAMFLRLRQRRPALVPHSGLVCCPYGHVIDLARAMVMAAENPAAVGEVFNITGDSVTAMHYIKTIGKIVGVEPEIVMVPDHVLRTLVPPLPFNHRFQNVLNSVLSIEKARRVLSFEPAYNFEAGHRQTYEWFLASGLDRLEAPLIDETWNISWNFESEEKLLEALRG